jgi:hypothetical protein
MFQGYRAVAYRECAREVAALFGKETGLKHPAEFALALYASGDLPVWQGVRVRLHTSRCAACRNIVAAYRADRIWVEQADQIPEGVNWDRLSAEMTANIRVGLAAGECVAPRARRKTLPGALAHWQWKPVAAAAGVVLLLTGAWWLNVPAAQNESLGRAFKAIAHRGLTVNEERGPMVEATSAGIKLFENGGALGVDQGSLRPVAVSVDAQGSASARYVDTDTGQVTITSVYVQ